MTLFVEGVLLYNLIILISVSLLPGVKCGIPPFVLNGQPSYSGIYFGDETTYECKPGFKLEGQEAIKCLSTGKWEAVPICRSKFTNSSGYYDNICE